MEKKFGWCGVYSTEGGTLSCQFVAISRTFCVVKFSWPVKCTNETDCVVPFFEQNRGKPGGGRAGSIYEGFSRLHI